MDRWIDDLQSDESPFARDQRIGSNEANFRNVAAGEQLNAVLDGTGIVFRLDDVVLAVSAPQRSLDGQILVLRVKMFHRFRLVRWLSQSLLNCCH